MPVISCNDDVIDEMKSSNRMETFRMKECPVCWSCTPKWLFVDEYGEVVGCNDCLRVEYVGEDPEC